MPGSDVKFNTPQLTPIDIRINLHPELTLSTYADCVQGTSPRSAPFCFTSLHSQYAESVGSPLEQR